MLILQQQCIFCINTLHSILHYFFYHNSNIHKREQYQLNHYLLFLVNCLLQYTLIFFSINVFVLGTYPNNLCFQIQRQIIEVNMICDDAYLFNLFYLLLVLFPCFNSNIYIQLYIIYYYIVYGYKLQPNFTRLKFGQKHKLCSINVDMYYCANLKFIILSLVIYINQCAMQNVKNSKILKILILIFQCLSYVLMSPPTFTIQHKSDNICKWQVMQVTSILSQNSRTKPCKIFKKSKKFYQQKTCLISSTAQSGLPNTQYGYYQYY
eukprot:TRINITY_DN2909_c0_g1_i6.p1 TRINITY_DN2909_c0_g1~~TRINITY_DN2909_c0_g1_i6.p1  ORF type:complete len:265 (+),score=-50.09 TRINITY_DN2909_c0_g1_i6:497-1291(+)